MKSAASEVSVSLSEAEVHWRTFLTGLLERGLHGVRLLVSDDHAGLKPARRATLPSVPWQRCQFHLQQNAQAYVPKVAMRKEVAQAIRALPVFSATSRPIKRPFDGTPGQDPSHQPFTRYSDRPMAVHDTTSGAGPY